MQVQTTAAVAREPHRMIGIDGPDLSFLDYFQGHGQGYVHLQRAEDADRMPNIDAAGFYGAFPINSLLSWEERSRSDQVDLLWQIADDAYVSINTLSTANGRPNRESYTRLSAAWVDCDYGHEKAGIGHREAATLVRELVHRAVLPPVSVVEWTGRGLRLYWLLQATGNDADHQDRARLEAVNKALAEILLEHCPQLGPDLGARWTTTHQRIAGSTNTKAKVRVVYEIPQETPPRYALSDLDRFCEIEVSGPKKKREWTRRTVPLDSAAGKKARARKARFVYLWNELKTIEQGRGGFQEGTRSWAAAFAVTILRALGFDDEAIGEELEELGQNCRPVLAPAQLKSAFRSGTKRREPPRNRTIAENLALSIDEANRLGLKKIRPDFEFRPSAGKTKAARIERHRQLEGMAVGKATSIPYTVDQLARQLGCMTDVNYSCRWAPIILAGDRSLGF